MYGCKNDPESYNYVQANYIDITLDDLAEKFFLSKPYLSKYIKEKSGMTFGDLVKKIRMKKAKALLKSSNMTVEILQCQSDIRMLSISTDCSRKLTI